MWMSFTSLYSCLILSLQKFDDGAQSDSGDEKFSSFAPTAENSFVPSSDSEGKMCVCVCVCACVHACVRACERACEHMCMCMFVILLMRQGFI